jgi:hypothetical protein
MIMALNAADIGSPLCEQVAAICAEVAERHYAALAAGVADVADPDASDDLELHPAGPALTSVTVVDVSEEVLAGAAAPHVTVREEKLS